MISSSPSFVSVVMNAIIPFGCSDCARSVSGRKHTSLLLSLYGCPQKLDHSLSRLRLCHNMALVAEAAPIEETASSQNACFIRRGKNEQLDGKECASVRPSEGQNTSPSGISCLHGRNHAPSQVLFACNYSLSHTTTNFFFDRVVIPK